MQKTIIEIYCDICGKQIKLTEKGCLPDGVLIGADINLVKSADSYDNPVLLGESIDLCEECTKRYNKALLNLPRCSKSKAENRYYWEEDN